MAAKTQTTKAPSVPPNQTLYCSNLPDKLQKEQLRRALYMLFSTYGPVLDIIALKEVKHRGQAHIVFRDVQSSTQAMRALQGFEFFGKEMRIAYAKNKSDTIAKLDGTFKHPVDAEANGVQTTELQKSIFNAVPSSATNGVAPQGLPTKPISSSEEAKGTKRPREEEDEEDAPMEEDEDDAMMEESDED